MIDKLDIGNRIRRAQIIRTHLLGGGSVRFRRRPVVRELFRRLEGGPVVLPAVILIRQQLALRQEALARQAHIRLTARIVIAVPGLTLVLIRLISPDYLAVYDGPLGQLVLLGCLVWLAIGYAVLQWLGRLPSSPRVLVR